MSNQQEVIDVAETCCSVEGGRKSHHSDKTKANLITRLNRIEGQIRGIKGLIEKDTYCVNFIEGALRDTGVTGKVDLASGSVQVQYDEANVNLETIKQMIEEQGYDVA